MGKNLDIQIVSDVVCPWCYIGKRNYDKAIQSLKSLSPDLKINLHLRPFRLDPSIPSEGIPRDKVMEEKFGGKAHLQKIFSRTKKAAQDAGIQMEFLPGIQQPNTLDCHRLIRLAGEHNLQEKMLESLFNAYFTENKNLADQSFLSKLAIHVGISEKELAEFWGKGLYKEETESEELRMRSLGVTGVPFFILNGGYAFSGAQPPEVMESILLEIINNKSTPS
jgi:predicted DsbA family dithiol-disulfide isomerase